MYGTSPGEYAEGMGYHPQQQRYDMPSNMPMAQDPWYQNVPTGPRAMAPTSEYYERSHPYQGQPMGMQHGSNVEQYQWDDGRSPKSINMIGQNANKMDVAGEYDPPGVSMTARPQNKTTTTTYQKAATTMPSSSLSLMQASSVSAEPAPIGQIFEITVDRGLAEQMYRDDDGGKGWRVSFEAAHYEGVWCFIVVGHQVKGGRKKALCSPIFKYPMGLEKARFSSADANQHAIIYSKGRSPERFETEWDLKRKPIAVNMVGKTQPLHSASRIHFGKQYVIEGSEKEQPLGMATEEGLATISEGRRNNSKMTPVAFPVPKR